MKKMFAIYDAKAEAYMVPFFCDTVGLAIRQMEDVVSNPELSVSKYPEDFTLFEIGSYDPSTGTISGRDALLPLGNGLEFKRNLKDQRQLDAWPEEAARAADRLNGNHDSPG